MVRNFHARQQRQRDCALDGTRNIFLDICNQLCTELRDLRTKRWVLGSLEVEQDHSLLEKIKNKNLQIDLHPQAINF